MSTLNKIFYGSAGTGKTREATIEALNILNKSDKVDFSFNIDEEKDIFEKLKNYSKQRILNLPKDFYTKDAINDINYRDIDYLFDYSQSSGALKKAKISKDNILDYRLNPLIEMVTFHPSYSYQDFVEGITVETNENNEISYNVKDGIFKKICNRAIANPEYNYVLLIDEINRGDISSIFGELFTLLEDTKREELSINLPYSKDNMGNPEKLTVPNNLYIVATMNTVDKSIALIDVALRRRFDFVEMKPEPELLNDINVKIDDINLVNMLKAINERITILKNEHYQIGHSYFLKIETFDDLKRVMTKNIIPLLQEYFYDDWESICAVLNQPFKNPIDNQGLFNIKDAEKSKFLEEFNELKAYSNKKIIIVRDFNANDIKTIY
ncbi:MAG: AAA family ATPase [Patescibacteria group bacterium]|nr:AAA family ATPase [Patescibacteria group bacterium]